MSPARNKKKKTKKTDGTIRPEEKEQSVLWVPQMKGGMGGTQINTDGVFKVKALHCCYFKSIFFFSFDSCLGNNLNRPWRGGGGDTGRRTTAL